MSRIATGADAVRRPWLALTTTLSVQAGATLALTSLSVMAPAVAPLLDMPPQRVGWLVGLAYATAMASGLLAGAWAARTGAIPLSRLALLLSAAGLLVAAAAALPGATGLLPVGALLIGMAYGLPNPTASLVLARHAPSHRRGLFFSIKQTGVPVGVGLAALLVPPLLDAMPWPAALAVLAALCGTLALALRAARVLDDRDRSGGVAAAPPPAGPALLAPLRRVWRTPALRRLGVASLVYSMTQLSYVTFLVSYLALEHGRGLAAAAAVLAVSQVLSVVTRVAWGQVADRWGEPARLLGLLGLAMGVAIALLGALPPDLPHLTTAVALLCGATAMAWNGVFYAELAVRVRPEDMAEITGGTQVLTFAGAMIGPVAFAVLVGPLGGHGAAFMGLAALPAAVGAWMLARARG
jgi:MFS family permease